MKSEARKRPTCADCDEPFDEGEQRHQRGIGAMCRQVCGFCIEIDFAATPEATDDQ